ncbi:MAG: helix-turn-helix transcriptional regulator [Eubacteriales bacterium]|nr:helix-turn-helix transcriptional regulator [Eubacteriales bacterium]
MKTEFSHNLKVLMAQLNITSSQLSKALNVDPSLVSRWLKNGCGERKSSQHALSIGKYVLTRRLTPENRAWFGATLAKVEGTGITAERVALWLYPQADVCVSHEIPSVEFPNLLVVKSFHTSLTDSDSAESPVRNEDEKLFSVCHGADRIAELLRGEMEKLPPGAAIELFLSSETIASAVDKRIVDTLHALVAEKKLTVRMLVQSANNSAMSSRLVSAYMPLLVLGRLALSVVQGTPQTFTATMNVLVSDRSAILITEAAQKKATVVATVIRDDEMIADMRDNFETTMRFARPMMTAYDDSFARNIIEAFFEEYGVPGSLDVIKSGMNPMYMSIEQYGKVLEKFGHTGEQYTWRYNEFVRFKSAMDEVLLSSRFREVISLPKLKEIAETGRCKMPSMYFMDAGVWYLDAEDCVDILDGYIHYLEEVPDFQVILLSDENLFMPNSCWHIKNNKHIMIHSWDIDTPIMVYSDQLLLIDEFQSHFDHLWSQIHTAGVSKRVAVEALTTIRNLCAQQRCVTSNAQ